LSMLKRVCSSSSISSLQLSGWTHPFSSGAKTKGKDPWALLFQQAGLTCSLNIYPLSGMWAHARSISYLDTYTPFSATPITTFPQVPQCTANTRHHPLSKFNLAVSSFISNLAKYGTSACSHRRHTSPTATPRTGIAPRPSNLTSVPRCTRCSHSPLSTWICSRRCPPRS